MKTLWAVLAIFAGLFVAFIVASILCEAYKWVRRKTNKPRIGYDSLFGGLLRCDDYVCIDGKVLCFDHIASPGQAINVLALPLEENKTVGGEIAFRNPNAIGYLYYKPSALKNCEFIYGKYGVKWAVSKHWATVAEEKVKEANE